MAYSYGLFTVEEGNQIFPIPFPYIARGHVRVAVDGVDTDEWTFLNSSAVTLNNVYPNGTTVKVYRVTPSDTKITNFKDGSTFGERQLDAMMDQTLFIVQESMDALTEQMMVNKAGMWEGGGRTITNIGDPIEDHDVATAGWVKALPDINIAAAIAAANSADTARAGAEAAKNDTLAALDPINTKLAGVESHLTDVDTYVAEVRANTSKLAGGIVPIGAEFMWFADPADPLGGIPAGYVLAAGQELSRDTYPDLFTFASTGGRILSEVEWQAQAAANDGNVGFYSAGDGTTTFRMPNVRSFIRSGTPDKAGYYEGDAIRNITGSAPSVVNVTGVSTEVGAISQTNLGVSTLGVGSSRFNSSINFDASKVVPTASENRPKTVYRTMIVKAFSEAVNLGSVDVTQLASDVSTISGEVFGRIPFDYNAFASFADIKPYNLGGGTAVAGWNTRTLNTTLINNIAGCVLDSNAITIPAGRYWVSASACGYNVGRIMLALRDNTSGDVIMSGESGYVANSNQTIINLEGMLVLDTERTVQLSQYCGSGSAGGLGTSIEYLNTVQNKYAIIKIWRVA